MTAISAACLPPSTRIALAAKRAQCRWIYAKRFHDGTWSLISNRCLPGSPEFEARQEFMLVCGYKLVVGTGEPIGKNGKEQG